ncbi:tyrosine-protein phosphatase [Streptomyces chattanoogensis]|uniref:tyrosine-protein phosphatase n=1 Tax=Streptomyces chattanoogensis TaxID=66876 RepID=UPI0006B47834|nr:tyrosine-protein phosphatase [Streptomyces chattanoogensis]
MNCHSTAAVLTARHIAESFVAAVSAVGATVPLASAAPPAVRRIPFTDATVTQHKDGSFTVSWKAPGVGSVTVCASGRAVAHDGSEATITVRGLPAVDRQWFRLIPDQGAPLTLADRSLRLEGAADLRDVGGYRTADGRWVRMGVLYRANDLHALTDADLAKLQRLGIRTDFDLRMPSARTKAPGRVPAGARYVVADAFDSCLRDGLSLSEQDLQRLRAALLTG